MSEQQVIDGEVVDEPGRELARRSEGGEGISLFRTEDPVEVIEKATAVADALKKVVVAQGLVSNIRGKEHPRVEAWQTLGAMLAVTAVCVHTGQTTDRHGKPAYEATVEARYGGLVVGRADAMCSTSEGRWKTADDYALRSMAQTRATSKALKGPLGWIMSLAGYETTPAEEMPSDLPQPNAQPDREPPRDPVETIDPGWAVKLLDQVREKGMSLGVIRGHLQAVGVSQAMGLSKQGIEKAVGRLSPAQATDLEGRLS